MQWNSSRKVKEVARRLKEALSKKGIKVERVYLFGSYARGDYLKDSDMDLIIVSNSWKDEPFLKRLDIVNEIVWKEGLGNVEAIPVTSEELKKKSSVVLRDASKYWVRIL